MLEFSSSLVLQTYSFVVMTLSAERGAQKVAPKIEKSATEEMFFLKSVIQ